MIYAGVPSFLGCVVRGCSYSNSLASTVDPATTISKPQTPKPKLSSKPLTTTTGSCTSDPSEHQTHTLAKGLREQDLWQSQAEALESWDQRKLVVSEN